MAGHSKWANIQHRKGAQDAKRGVRFTKLIREITVAARAGGGDLGSNPRLRLAVDKAKGQSVPKDTIERAIKKGTGELEGESYEEVRYEGYGPSGVAVMVDCMTDNRNRTVAEVRHAFSKYGGNLGADGSVAYLFDHRGVISFAEGTDEDRVMEVALDAGAEDVIGDEDGVDVLTDPNEFESVRDAMVAADLTPEESEVTMRPATSVLVEGDTAASTLRLLQALEDLDDVQQIYSNADFPADALDVAG
jgi:YebC/PmpR family DNA-binding regulatory protein